MKKLKGIAIAEIPLKIVQSILLFIAAVIVILVGAVGVGLGAGMAAAIGGAAGGSEGASESASKVEMPASIVNTFRVFLILAVAFITIGLALAIVTLVLLKKNKEKKSLKALAVFDILFFNPIEGIAILATKKEKFGIMPVVSGTEPKKD